MMLKRSTTESKPKLSARLVRAGLAGLAAVGTLAALATGGCLDRPLCTTECQPTTSNVFVDQIVQTSVDKIDLLFMVDNSVSMADKQEILADAVPVLVNRLIQPICVDEAGKPTGGQGTCTNGSPEFNPIGDIHIGIVSSSLGAHGGAVCASQITPQDTPDDKARLIGSMRPDTFPIANTWNSSGFLAWDSSGDKNNPPGTKDAPALVKTFQDMIASVGEHGCGYEASMESWYRFLVDPEPPANVTLAGGATVRGSKLQQADGKLTLGADGRAVCDGCDETLLAQRRAFLRPDSLVAIIMLSDENDCSIRDDGVGWFVGSNTRMPRSTAACDSNPNDKCCRSCATSESAPPSGCPALADDAVCKANPPGGYTTWDIPHDSLNLRCYKQHQRFGFDLLYETQRYVNALKNQQINLQSTGLLVTNPLYDATGTDKAPRDPSLVFLAGIVGVPWQDIATEETRAPTAGLTYLTAAQMREQNRWTALLGDPSASPPTLPTDPFMIETTGNPDEGHGTVARTGANPFTGDMIVAATSNNPKASAINGHEQVVPSDKLDDLQYACIFPLTTPKTCAKGDAACDCSPDKNGDSSAVTAANSPLCQGGANINTQTHAKAYPGARHLQVLKDFGDNAIVASICPKFTATTTTKASDPNYGYNPAVGAIIERLKEALAGKCLPRPLTLDAASNVQCKVIEAQKVGCNCSGDIGRADTDPAILGAVQAQLKATGNCDSKDPDCKSWCTCEILQAKDGDLTACRNNQTPSKPTYCYISKGELDPAGLTNKCPSNQPQLLRFAEANGVKTPAQGSVSFIACLGAPVGAGVAGGGAM